LHTVKQEDKESLEGIERGKQISHSDRFLVNIEKSEDPSQS